MARFQCYEFPSVCCLCYDSCHMTDYSPFLNYLHFSIDYWISTKRRAVSNNPSALKRIGLELGRTRRP